MAVNYTKRPAVFPLYPDGANVTELAVNARGEQVVAAVATDSTGNAITALPPGRANASASVPVVLSNEDNTALRGAFKRATAVGATAGDAVLVSGVTTAGSVNFTLVNGGSLVINVPLGSTQLPYAVTAASLGTAVGGTFQSLFYL